MLNNEDAPGKTPNPDRLLTTSETAAMIGLAKHTLDVWRMKNNPYGLPYIRSGRSIRYRESEVKKWLDRRTEGN